jgi:hypothetical protein
MIDRRTISDRLAQLLAAALLALLVVGCGRAERKQAPHLGPAAVEPHATPEAVVVDPASDDTPPAVAEASPPFSALMGYEPPTEGEKTSYLSTLEKPTLYEAAPQLFNARGPPSATLNQITAKPPILLYRPLREAHQRKYGKPWIVVRQTIGDCVSHGWAHAISILLAISYVNGDASDFDMVASEAQYGLMRVEGSGSNYGPRDDGASGVGAARSVTKFGVLFRLDYRGQAADEADLRIYSGSKARDWGYYGCGGKSDQGRLDAIARKHPVKRVALTTTFTEAAAAIENGYPVPVCYLCSTSSGPRDRDGYYDPRGRAGGHCTCFIGVRYDERGDPIALLMLNSWGPDWLSGPKFPDDQPDGSCWIHKSACESMLAGYRDSYAVSNLEGFFARKLRHAEGW